MCKPVADDPQYLLRTFFTLRFSNDELLPWSTICRCKVNTTLCAVAASHLDWALVHWSAAKGRWTDLTRRPPGQVLHAKG